MNKIIGYCPICGKRLNATKLRCAHCETEMDGEFSLSAFDYLSKEQQEFAVTFIRRGGNIKLIERELEISYPTVKKMLDDLIRSLDGEGKAPGRAVRYGSKEEVYAAVKAGDISIREAQRLMLELEQEVER